MSSVNGVNGASNSSETGWKVGMINIGTKKYLTAETFGHKINVSGSNLKKRQTFVLVQHPREEVVYIKSHLGCYLSADKYGNVTCDLDELDPGSDSKAEQFVVEYDKKGRWAFRNVEHNNYLQSGNEETVRCFEKTMTDSSLWSVQLSIHPQVHLRNVNRKRYAHMCDEQLQVTQTVPWGEKALLFLDFVDGKYCLKTCDRRYLHTNGELAEKIDDGAKFNLEIKAGQNRGLAFRDCNECCLTGVGPTATMKGRNKTVGKDELFTLEDTHPQVVIVASNNKKVSIKQSVDVSANQDDEEASEREIFQMEYQRCTGKWAFRTVDNKYWVLEPLGGIQAVSSDITDMTLFDIDWLDDGSMSIRAKNGNYVYNKPAGSLYAGSESVSDKEKFRVMVVNRPALVLKSDFGFVGTTPKGEVQCNRTSYDVIQLEHCPLPNQEGVYLLKASNGKHWRVDDDGSIKADGSSKSNFTIQWRGTTITIRADNGSYIKGEQNGLFRAIGNSLEDNGIFWEF